MRFFWLSLGIVFPFIALPYIDKIRPSEYMEIILICFTATIEIILLGLCISRFLKEAKKQAHIEKLQIQHERDEDIKKWRKEFLIDVIGLYDAQDEFFTKAKSFKNKMDSKEESEKSKNK